MRCENGRFDFGWEKQERRFKKKQEEAENKQEKAIELHG
jgi:hypothetical protein